MNVYKLENCKEKFEAFAQYKKIIIDQLEKEEMQLEQSIMEYVGSSIDIIKPNLNYIKTKETIKHFIQHNPEEYLRSYLNNREYVLIGVTVYPKSIKVLCDEFKKDREIVIAAVSTDGLVIEHVDFKGDREIAVIAVENNQHAYKYLHNDLRLDKEIAIKVANSQEVHYSIIDEKMYSDRDVALEIVKNAGDALEHVPFKDDDEIVLAAIKNDFGALEFAPDKYKNDYNFVKSSIKLGNCVASILSDDFKKDKELCLKIVMSDPGELEYMDESIRDDKDIVMAAVSRNGYSLEYASPRLQSDEEVVFAAMMKEGGPLEYADPKFCTDDEFLERLIDDGYSFGFAIRLTKYRSVKKIALATVSKQGNALEYLDPELQKDREIVLAAVANYGGALEYAHPDLREDREIVEVAVKSGPTVCLKYVGDSLSRDKQITLDAIRHMGESVTYIHPDLQTDRDIIIAGIMGGCKGFLPSRAKRIIDDDKILKMLDEIN